MTEDRFEPQTHRPPAGKHGAPFPRRNDGKPHAWGLAGTDPYEIWERFSPSYEAQAQAMWEAFENMGLVPALEWAGSQDGEAIIGRDHADEIVVLYHLENPEEARMVQQALASGTVMDFIERSLNEERKETERYRKLDAEDS